MDEHGELSSDNSNSTTAIECISPASPVKMKCKREKENKRTDAGGPEPMLPPCRICAEKASGFHYGANTCEACKAFFRRSLHKGTVYKCAASGKCEVLPGKRNSCPACRLQKCIDIGMSKSAIKTGRYTHAKKAKDIMEVKGMKELEAVSTDAGPRNMDYAYENKSPTSSIERMAPSPGPSVEELENIINHITTIQVKHTTYTPEFYALREKNEKVYLEQRLLNQQLFGPLKPVTSDEYMRIYESTGIDIDGRRDLLQSGFLPYIETCIKKYVTFLKSIPGFVQLPIGDQTALVKASRFDCWMLLGQGSFNPDERLYINNDGRVASIEELIALSDADFVNRDVFELQRKLQKLTLKEDENCILAALTVMATDNCDLQAIDQVARCHSLLLNCFLHLVDKYHGDDPLFIARVISILVDLRSLRESHRQVEEQVALRWSDVVDIPPLLYEMWSSL